MALKNSEASGTTVLELALYKIYTWQGVTYEQGKPYRFRNQDAMVLLSETDTGRQVWKIHRPERPKQAPKSEIVDATMIQAPVPIEETFGSRLNKDAKRIEIGDDSEIQDILNANTGGDVTV